MNSHRHIHMISCRICGKSFRPAEVVSGQLLHGGLVESIRAAQPEWTDDCYICRADLHQFRHQFLEANLAAEQGELSELQKEVLKSVEENESVVKDLNAEFAGKLSFGDRLADKVATFGGSWKFIIIFGGILFCWIILNSIALLHRPFDPFPFILLNLVLSCVASIQAPVIMMSQNRQEEKDRLRAEQDFRTNLKAELEIRTLHAKIDELITHQWQRLLEIQQLQMEMMEEIIGHRQSEESAAGK